MIGNAVTPDSDKPLEGKRAIVTGATRGIGRAIAARLAIDGAAVIGTGTASQGGLPSGCTYRQLQLTDQRSVDAMCALIEKEAPHILINNAGASNPQTWHDLDAETFKATQELNLIAPMLMCRAAIPGMRKHGWGRFVSISAMPGPVFGRATRASFGAAKAGLVAVHMSLAAELAADGILANCVAPGFIETDAIAELFSEEEALAMARQTPQGRLGKPEEVAALVAFLAGPDNTYMTGQHIFIDGGYARTL